MGKIQCTMIVCRSTNKMTCSMNVMCTWNHNHKAYMYCIFLSQRFNWITNCKINSLLRWYPFIRFWIIRVFWAINSLSFLFLSIENHVLIIQSLIFQYLDRYTGDQYKTMIWLPPFINCELSLNDLCTLPCNKIFWSGIIAKKDTQIPDITLNICLNGINNIICMVKMKCDWK